MGPKLKIPMEIKVEKINRVYDNRKLLKWDKEFLKLQLKKTKDPEFSEIDENNMNNLS